MNIKKLPGPIIGLAPMDGVTDHPLRYIYSSSFKPDLVFTEFINTEALTRGQPQVMEYLRYAALERPIIAQLSGKNPKSFYTAALILCFLGFDGIDVNLGCPARTVVKNGGGAALIGKYEIVLDIIKECRRAINDFQNGFNPRDLKLKEKQYKKIEELISFSANSTPGVAKTPANNGKNPGGYTRLKAELDFPGLKPKDSGTRAAPTLSVKTRTGFKQQNKSWLRFLFAQNLDMINLHGRTAKQGYGGRADWDFITWANNQKPANTFFLGNGDIKNQADIVAKLKLSGASGVLVGRGALGNPWIFKDLTILNFKLLRESANWQERSNLREYIKIFTPSKENRLRFLLKHLNYFHKIYPDKNILPLRKHFAWYCRGFKGAKTLRGQLMKTTGCSEVISIISKFTNAC